MTQQAPEQTDGSATVRRERMVGFVNAGEAFWDYLEAGEFRICRCAECHAWLWESSQGGADVRCGACGSWTIEWTPVDMEGSVYSWVTTNQPVQGVEQFHAEIPYVTIEAQVAGPRGPRVFGLLRGPRDTLAVGARVVGEIEPPSPETRGYAAVRWRLAASESAGATVGVPS